MRNACDSDSRCGLACDASACDASARDAKSLATRVERCEPLRLRWVASSLATCHVRDSVAVRVRVTEKEKVMQILGREDLVGFCASPVVAARATPVGRPLRKLTCKIRQKNPPKKSALTFCRCGVSTCWFGLPSDQKNFAYS